MIQLTNAQARRYLAYLHFASRGNELMDHVRGLRSVQFDPLDVVGRNPDLVMQSRIRTYKPKQLYDALYRDRVLLDGFDKCLCIYPIEEYPHFTRMRAVSAHHMPPEIANLFDCVRAEIEAHGPVCSDDIEMDETGFHSWGRPTKAARAALEGYWNIGKLTLSHKKGVRRYYDLIERHVPGEILNAPDPHVDDEAYYEWLIMRRIEAVGMLWNKPSDAFVSIPGLNGALRKQCFDRLVERGDLAPAWIEGIESAFYIPTKNLPILEASLSAREDKAMRFLAPLDNLIWDRKLIEAMFGFYYRWEVYTPRDKRAYGYYVLPVMYGDRFVARFEPAHFRGGTLVIRNWWWEAGVKQTKGLIAARERALGRFCRFLGADGYVIETEHHV